jgi:hypothetical protein
MRDTKDENQNLSGVLTADRGRFRSQPPEKMLTISGTNQFSRRSITCRLRATFVNRRSMIGGAAGIVKHGNAVGPCSTNRRSRIDPIQAAAV